MSSPRASFTPHLPPMRTPRQRLAVAGGALLLGLFLWALWVYCDPGRLDLRKTWFSVEFTADNGAHPVHLTLPEGREGVFDLMVVENLADQPLSLLPFSSRPRAGGLSVEQEMAAWANWIATNRQGIIVEPRSTWFLDPKALDRLPAVHGHTWIAVYFAKGPSPVPAGRLPATVLPGAFSGTFKVHYCPSRLSREWLAATQSYRSDLVAALEHESSVIGKTFLTLGKRALYGPTRLTEAERR
ncbi:MAG: hypothetical protein ACOYXN_08920 [Acidobacteriota bacterium]